jgi:hypothetical protein
VGCTGTDRVTEYEFIWSLDDRVDSWDCCGPMLSLAISPYRLALIIDAIHSHEEAFHSSNAYQVLWAGHASAVQAWGSVSPDRVIFALCAAHWMDLSFLTGLYGRLYERRDWMAEGTGLLKEICITAGWDVKEIANMIAWRKREFI